MSGLSEITRTSHQLGMGSESELMGMGTTGDNRMLGEKEVNWALGGAALGLTVAIVEFVANNVFDKSGSNQFAERRRGEYSRNKKFKDVLNDYKYGDYYYYEDYSNAFGLGDYNSQFRSAVKEHYKDDDFYDYEDYSYSQFSKKIFSPTQETDSKLVTKNLSKGDARKNHQPPKSNSNRNFDSRPSSSR